MPSSIMCLTEWFQFRLKQLPGCRVLNINRSLIGMLVIGFFSKLPALVLVFLVSFLLVLVPFICRWTLFLCRIKSMTVNREAPCLTLDWQVRVGGACWAVSDGGLLLSCFGSLSLLCSSRIRWNNKGAELGFWDRLSQHAAGGASVCCSLELSLLLDREDETDRGSTQKFHL